MPKVKLWFAGEGRKNIIFTVQSLLQMGYCCQSTRTSVRLHAYLRMYVRKIVWSKTIFPGFWNHQISNSWPFLNFLIKKWFFELCPFFYNKRAYSRHTASQVIYADIVLFADFESTKWYALTFFSFFQKPFLLAVQPYNNHK